LSGKLEAIWIKRGRRNAMDGKQSAKLIAGKGLENNADIGGKRQVTIISSESWRQMMSELRAEVAPSARRANLMVSGVDLRSTRGRSLKIGPCLLKVNGETRPCERMDEAFAGLRRAMDPDWRGGIYAEVVTDGYISVGDQVEWLE